MKNINVTICNSTKCTVFPTRTAETAYKIFCSSIITFAVILNTYEIYIYLVKRVRQTTFNRALANLAAANTLQAIGYFPYLFVDLQVLASLKNKIVERVVCGLVDGISIYFAFAISNAFILAFLSVHRYLVVKHPLRNYVIKTRWLIVGWLYGILWLVPNLLTMRYVETFCFRDFGGIEFIGKMYKASLSIFGLFVPLGIMVLTYRLTIRTFNQNTELGTAESARLRYRKAVIRLLGCLILVQFISWCPFGCYFFFKMLYKYEGCCANHTDVFIYKCIMIPCLFAPLWNVIFHSSYCHEYRRAFFQTFGKIIKRAQPVKNDENEQCDAEGADDQN